MQGLQLADRWTLAVDLRYRPNPTTSGGRAGGSG